jgi:hypothetical protein
MIFSKRDLFHKEYIMIRTFTMTGNEMKIEVLNP